MTLEQPEWPCDFLFPSAPLDATIPCGASHIHERTALSTHSPPRARRFLALSLRSLMVLVLVFGAGLGWWARSARLQRQAVLAIKRAGGFVSYDYEFRYGVDTSTGKPRVPKWLLDRVGVDYFYSVTDVSAVGVSDADAARLKDLPRLERLTIATPKISDRGIASIARIRSLRSLTIMGNGGSGVSGKGLSALGAPASSPNAHPALLRRRDR